MTERLNRSELLYSIVLVFAIHSHESAMGVPVSPHSEIPSHLSPHPIPLDCPRAPALIAPLHASNLHQSFILHTVYICFNAILSNHPTLTFSPRVQKSILYICASSAVSHIGSIVTIFLNSIYMC